jgi:UDP-3-O-[3-hydroxymyristoyl] glucosamine N-acyltransferase
LENAIGLNNASGLGTTVLSNKASIDSGIEGVGLIAGVKVTVGDNVIVGDKVIVGVSVIVGVRVIVGDGGKIK